MQCRLVIIFSQLLLSSTVAAKCRAVELAALSRLLFPAFKSYCGSLGAQISYASVAHPRSNGQAERANAEVLKGLKTRSFNRLKSSGKHWIDELPSVLWSIRTVPTKSTGETPFSLVYGAEAVLPSEITPALRESWLSRRLSWMNSTTTTCCCLKGSAAMWP